MNVALETDMHRFYCDYDAISLYQPGEFNCHYKTSLDSKVREIERELLAEQDVHSFLNDEYKTYMTTEELVLYRIFGLYKPNKDDDDVKGARNNGRFLTTEFAESQIDAKIRLALDPRWKNIRMYEAKVIVPVETTISVGIVAPIATADGTVLAGGAEQIMLPYNWNEDWITGYRRVAARQLQVVPKYPLKKPDPVVLDDVRKPICPICCDTNTVELCDNEKFTITGCKGGEYTMKLHCLNKDCGYYW